MSKAQEKRKRREKVLLIEQSILLAGFAFISKELESFQQAKEITLKDIYAKEEHKHLKEIAELLRNLEVKMGNQFKNAETYLNQCIENLEKIEGRHNHISAVLGLGILTTYKDSFKGKKLGVGIKYDTLLSIYNLVEDSSPEYSREITSSLKIADSLYDEITNNYPVTLEEAYRIMKAKGKKVITPGVEGYFYFDNTVSFDFRHCNDSMDIPMKDYPKTQSFRAINDANIKTPTYFGEYSISKGA